jgi:hypothetical protein
LLLLLVLLLLLLLLVLLLAPRSAPAAAAASCCCRWWQLVVLLLQRLRRLPGAWLAQHIVQGNGKAGLTAVLACDSTTSIQQSGVCTARAGSRHTET